MTGALLLLLAASWQGPAVPCDTVDTLRLADVVALARTANPGLKAARLMADAAAERVPEAGALPDPELSLGLMNRMVSGFGSTTEPMTMNQVQLTQTIPWPGKLGLARNAADRTAHASALDADQAELTLVARVTGSYYELAYMDRALAIMDRSRVLLRQFLGVSQAMYGVGTGLQQDVLQAQVAVARMTEEITVMADQRVARAARLNALLGRDATAPIGVLELPETLDTLPAVDSLMALAAVRRPALKAAGERVEAAESRYRAARRELWPNLMLGVSYGQRPQFGDMASLMIGVRLPVWAGSRQLPLRRETEAMQAMAEAQSRDLYNETFAQLLELRADAMRSISLERLYATSFVPQAHAAVDAALSAYRVGKVDFMSLVENQMNVNRYETERVRLLAQYQAAVASIGALVDSKIGGGS